MILKNISLLYGNDLKFIESTNVKITKQKFQKINQKINSSKEKIFDCKGLLLIPGLINSHTHIGDSIGKDISLNSDVDARIHPVSGIKKKILTDTPKKQLARFMRKSAISMLKKGITTFVDFREGGIAGIQLLKYALRGLPIRAVILGRIDYYQTIHEIKDNTPMPKLYQTELDLLLRNCDGVGISGANENSNSNLQTYSKIKELRVIHSAETLQSYSLSKKYFGKTEPKRALLAKPTFLVHMTFASKSDLREASKKTRGIVICPRANAALAEGIPDIELMEKTNCNLAIGTDNVMINSPDLFREMDYLWKVSMGLHKKRIDPKKILKMTTVNAGKILQQKIGSIKEGFLADCIFLEKKSLDLDPLNNPYAAVVHRATENSIKAVMIGGEFIHGKI
jgi:cytosine/adenosine deaminase-related metal-dependent hydrolase|tara:strand:+ start:2706 stop:3893 length:1188 start_codon:yes stop_codon:yes gene_type:complete